MDSKNRLVVRAISRIEDGVRRFNALFIERYRINPSQLRKASNYEGAQADTFDCYLAFRPPYDWHSMLRFLRARASSGLEYVDSEKYMRTMRIDDAIGWIAVSRSEKASLLLVTLSSSLAPKFLQVLTRLKRLFDLQAKPEAIDERLGELAIKHPGLRVPGACDSFEVSIRAILGQLVSVKTASNLAGKVAEKYGKRIKTPFPQLSLLTPQPVALARARVDELVGLGIMQPRAQTIINFAREYLQGKLVLHPGVDYDKTVAQLTSLPGIGQWTADYIAMRCLAYPDAFPAGDLGIKKALKSNSQKALIAKVEKYRPWRAYAAMHIWKTLEKKIETEIF